MKRVVPPRFEIFFGIAPTEARTLPSPYTPPRYPARFCGRPFPLLTAITLPGLLDWHQLLAGAQTASVVEGTETCRPRPRRLHPRASGPHFPLARAPAPGRPD